MTYNVFSGTLNPTHFTSLLAAKLGYRNINILGNNPKLSVWAKAYAKNC